MTEREKEGTSQLRFFCVDKKGDGEFSAIIIDLRRRPVSLGQVKVYVTHPTMKSKKQL